MSLERALLDFGIDPRAVDLSLVETWQRLPTTDKPRSRNGAVCVLPDGAVAIQNWATGERTVWQPGRGSAARPLSAHRNLQHDVDRARARRQREQADAAALASRLWDRARPAGADHPYLRRKNLPPLELREVPELNGWLERWLICPLYSADPLERIRNLEGINSRGDKRPVKNALRRAVYGFAGPGMPTGTVVLGEGWATAAALHVSLQIPIVFAAGAHNLAPVAAIWRKGLPNAEMIIAADNDTNGTGMATAREAAEAAGGALIKMPNFGIAKRDRTDWCDVYTAWGAEFVREAWNHG